VGSSDNYYDSTFSYSCTAPLPSGTGNLSADPLFRLPAVGDLRLSPGSPCLNAGANVYAVGSVDLLGNPRIQEGSVDMGACEGAWTLATDAPHLARNVSVVGGTNGIAVSWDAPLAPGAGLYRVCRMETAMGQWTPVSGWIAESSYQDFQVFGGVSYRYAIVSAFDARLDLISGLSTPIDGQRILLPQVYVDASRLDDADDGRSWSTAKRTIQAAIGVATPYDTILVTNGVYAPISTTNNAIIIRSVNGEDVTVIDGGGTNRCATLGGISSHLNTILVGFTLRNGYASFGGGACYGRMDTCTLIGNSASVFGGGSYDGILNNCTLSGNKVSTSASGGGSCFVTLNNCKLTGNSASEGGGSYGGTLNNCTLWGNSASFGGGSHYGTLNNCTMTGNSAYNNGGGAYYGTLNSCTLTGNSASVNGGGSYYGLLNNCTLSLNRATLNGGGSCDGILSNCTLTGNTSSSYGGGSYYGTLNNCTLTANSAAQGGGAYYVTLNNCTLLGNSASSGGGSYHGALNNCTLFGNRASSNGGGSNYATLSNCIVWGNTLASGVTNNYVGGTFSYSCTTPLPAGNGNISGDPLFRLPAAGDCRLSPESPCLNSGVNTCAVGSVDLLGNPRIQNGTVDMGACEGAWVLASDDSWLARMVTAVGGVDGIAVSWDSPLVGSAVLYRVFRMDMATGLWTPISGWINELSFMDTQVFGGVICRYAIVTAFDDQLYVISGLSALAETQRALPQFYVDASRPDDTGDGRSWQTAKRNVQVAIDLATPYDTVFVTNGVYGPISTANKEISIQSVNGAAVTIIDGGGTNRCATLGSNTSHLNTSLIGFSLRNGSASSGGGSCYGTLNNCTLSGNSSSSSGGGSYYGTLRNCALTGNRATSSGGGTYYGTLSNCVLTGNSASSGGGSYYGTLNNCTLSGNSAKTSGGGSSYGALNNCKLVGNDAFSGGGSYAGELNNCTLTGNRASSSGGGAYAGILNNTIVWGNTLASGVTNNYFGVTFSYSCSIPLPSGTENISSDPLFNDEIKSNFMLRVGSPCINMGNNLTAAGTTDLLGNPRILADRVDMGAYEMPPTVTVTFDANGGLLATGQSITNRVGFSGDCYDSWLTLSNGISRVGYTFSGWFSASIGGVAVLSNHTITAGRIYAQWILAPPIIPGNPNVSSNFLDNVTQAQVDALVAGLRVAQPEVTDSEIAKKFEDADLFGFTGAAFVGVGADALVRLNPSITLSTLSVVEGDPKMLLVTVTIENNIDPTSASALARLGEAINSRMRGVFRNSLSAGASETILIPALSLDNATGIITATFTLDNPSAPSGFLRMSLRK
jgi:hypothetical protein